MDSNAMCLPKKCVHVCVCRSYLSGVVYWRASQVNDEVIYPMFPQGNEKHNYPLRLGSPSLLFLSLLALYWSMESSLKRSKNTGEKQC